MLLWPHLLPLRPFARIYCLNQNNQSQPGGVSDRVSSTAPAHTEGSNPPPRDKQPPNHQAMRKLPVPPLSTTTYTKNISKQKKLHEEKQAKKKELDWAMLRSGALEMSGNAVERVGEGPGSPTVCRFKCCVQTTNQQATHIRQVTLQAPSTLHHWASAHQFLVIGHLLLGLRVGKWCHKQIVPITLIKSWIYVERY